MKKNKLFFIFFFIFSFLVINPVFALEITDYPRVPGAAPPQDFVQTALPEEIVTLYFLYFYNLIIWLSGLIVLGVLVYAGFLYLTSSGNAQKIASARDQFFQAFLGIIILFSSYLVLQILNPQLTIIQLPPPAPPPVLRPEIPAPEIEPLVSSIDTELPFGRIIEERIFETYVAPGETRKPRMTRIRENSENSLRIAEELKDSNEELVNTVQGGCSCGGPMSTLICREEGLPCSCDPCANVRGNIEDIEQNKNLPKIEEMKAEREITIEEVKQLKFELEKLERLENYFTQDCRLWLLQSLRGFLIKADGFIKENAFLRRIRFWDDIDTVYWSQREQKEVRDWATFYCLVGGTTFFEQPPQPPLEEPAPEIPGEYTEVIKSCPREAPVGEIIDRAKRIAKLLIERLEELIHLQGEMISLVDGMHVLVSECSSQKCICVKKFFFSYCKSIPGIPVCPFPEISAKLEEIRNTQEYIDRVVNEEEDEGIGIIPTIDRKVPSLLEDLELEVRYPMRMCITKGEDKVLFDTQKVIGALDPKGMVIRAACYKEPVFEGCLEACFLEEGQENYRKCLTECLDDQAEQYDLEEIAWCRHSLNFYCCNVKKELVK